ncbi:MarR family transcriptional regulator [Nostoc sp. 3335mG]|nr:MarR family transcriptional regulator [Nostoc sp. 3335mG]
MQLPDACKILGAPMSVGDTSRPNELLVKAGIDPDTAGAVMEIDALMMKWRRRAMRRELGHRALRQLKLDLDLPEFDALTAIEGPHEPGEERGETMVSTVADRLNIDPSRASRMVSELVEKGYARRAVSQADARRTIIELSARGRAVVDAVSAYKYLIMGDFLGGWDRAELAAFVPLLRRFSNWMDGIDPTTEKYSDDIAGLAARIAEADRATEPV